MNNDSEVIMVRTVDTDVIAIIVGILSVITTLYPDAKIWVAFGKGKDFTDYSINAISSTLGIRQSEALLFFHAFRGRILHPSSW